MARVALPKHVLLVSKMNYWQQICFTNWIPILTSYLVEWNLVNFIRFCRLPESRKLYHLHSFQGTGDI